jgi:hypothetical protein
MQIIGKFWSESYEYAMFKNVTNVFYYLKNSLKYLKWF